MNSTDLPHIVPGHEYHVVELEHVPTQGLLRWLSEQMPYDGEEYRRWIVRNNKIYFHNEMDHLLFLLNIDR